MRKKKLFIEEEKVEKKPEDKKVVEQGAEPEGGHPDAAQDAELIKKMISDSMGEGYAESEEAHAMAKEAMECYAEMGYEKEAAHSAVKEALKLAKHRAEKKKAQEADKAPPSDAAAEAKEAGTAGDPASQVPAVPKSKGDSALLPEMKESQKKVVELTAENAKLKKEIDSLKSSAHLEKILKESGLPNSASKSFRKLVEGVSDTKKLDENLKIFKEAFDSSDSDESDKSKEGSSKGMKESNGGEESGFLAFFGEKLSHDSSKEGSSEGGFESFVTE